MVKVSTIPNSTTEIVTEGQGHSVILYKSNSIIGWSTLVPEFVYMKLEMRRLSRRFASMAGPIIKKQFSARPAMTSLPLARGWKLSMSGPWEFFVKGHKPLLTVSEQ